MKHARVSETLSTAVRLHRAGQFAKAEQGYRQVLRRSPRNADALRLLGILACQSGQAGEGLRLLRKAAKANRHDATVHLDLAQALADNGKLKEAIMSFRRAASLAPQDPLAWGGLATALFASGRTAEAIRTFEKALALDPGHADLYVGLGNALRNLGNLAGAYEELGKAVALRPDYAEAYTNLGNVAIELGNLDAAIVHHRQAVELKPELSQAYHNLGCTYQTARNYTEAAKAFREAHERDPGNFDSLYSLGAVLKELGRLEESLDALREAHDLRPGDNACTLLFVLVLRALNRPAEDVERINEGIEPASDRAEGLAALANALEALNDRESASKAAEKALAIDGDHMLANVVAARLERRHGDAKTARDRLTALRNRNGPLDGAANTVLGQAHDRLGEYAAAFDAFATAKRITGDQFGDDVSEWRAHFMDHIHAFRSWYTPEKAARWENPDLPDDRSNPIFFVGFPRSGTTLFEQMLNSHPALATTGETQILGRLQLVAPSLLKRDSESPEILDDLEPSEVATLGRWYLDEVARHGGFNPARKRIVDKMPLNIVEVGFIRRIFPRASIIVALRDPRDVILSCFMQNFRINRAMAHFLTVEGTAKLYAAVMELWLHYRSDPGLNRIEYRYEDLVADTEGVARRVFAFLGEPWDEGVLAFQDRARERFVSTPSYADVSTPIYDRSVGRWRNYAEQLAPTLPILAPFVREFGYPEA